MDTLNTASSKSESEDFADSHLKSVCKAISYRIFGSLTTFLIAYAFTKDAGMSTGITIVELVSKIVIFYFHERLWFKIRFIK
jgi:uncharacterized membrane protein